MVKLLKLYPDGVPPGSELTSLQSLNLELRNQSPDQPKVIDTAFQSLQEDTQNAEAM